MNAQSILWLLGIMQIDYESLGPNTFIVNDLAIVIVASCTSIAAFLGAIPLFWRGTWSLWNGLLRSFIYFIPFQALNILRIGIGLNFYDRGYSWETTHTMPSGLFYVCLLLWALRHGRWLVHDGRMLRLKMPDSSL